MEKGDRLRERKCYRMINSGLLACMGLLGGAWILEIDDISVAGLLAAALAFALLASLHFLKARGRIMWCLMLAAWAWMLLFGREESLAFFRAFPEWIAGNREGYAQWDTGFQALASVGVAVAAYLLQLFFERFPVCKLIFAGALAAGLVYCLFAEIQLPHLAVAFLLCYIVMTWVERTQGRWEKVRSGNGMAQMLWIMPFLALYLLLLSCTPAPKEPYGWPWVSAAYVRLREAFLTYSQRIHWGGREGFGMAFSGFSEDGQLRGDLEEEAREVMALRIESGRVENVYLSGRVYDAFDGRGWAQEDFGEFPGGLVDTAQTLCAVRAFDSTHQRDYMRDAELDIQYRYFNTGFLFAPLKTWRVEEEGLAYTCEEGGLSFPESQGYGTRYQVQYYQLNTGQEEFDRFLEEQEGHTEQADLEEMCKRNGLEVDAGAINDYRHDIYERYLGEAVLSEEVAAYLTRMTEGAGTKVEKLRAIERELSSYTYTRMPGSLPERIGSAGDFLDYFLLESRQGYCTYFATAFVLLARAEGIPARYVEGFCVPVDGMAEVNVYSDMAHAWPEVYLEGIGWIPFEPTPGYGQRRCTSWQVSHREDGDRPAAGQWEERQEEAGRAAEPEIGQEEAQEAEAEALREEARRERRYREALVRFLLLLAAGCGGMLLLDNMLRGYRYRRMGPEERFRLEVQRNLRILSLCGLRRGTGETLQELRERGQEREISLSFLEDLEGILYGGETAGEETVREAIRERQALMALLKKEKRSAYLYCWLRLHLIRYH